MNVKKIGKILLIIIACIVGLLLILKIVGYILMQKNYHYELCREEATGRQIMVKSFCGIDSCSIDYFDVAGKRVGTSLDDMNVKLGEKLRWEMVDCVQKKHIELKMMSWGAFWHF